MKTAVVFLIIGAVAGAFGWSYYQRTQNPTLGQRAGAIADQTREAAVSAKDAVAGKAEDWHLTPQTIKEELAKTGRVVRSNAKVAGERIDDARIIAVIKAKYVMANELSALAIGVDCRDGAVTLSGSVTSAEHIAQAVTLALQTGGVRHVESQLAVRN